MLKQETPPRDLADLIRNSHLGKPLTATERGLIQLAGAGGSVVRGMSTYAKTFDELAQRLGLSRKTLQNSAKRFPEEVPRPRADGRHDVAAWSEFVVAKNIARAAESIVNAASAEREDDKPITVTDWKAKELELKCQKLEIENLKVAGELVGGADVESGLSTLVAAFRQALNNFGPRLASKVLNVSDYHEAEEIVQNEINVVLRTLQHCEFLNDHAPDALKAAAEVAVKLVEIQPDPAVKPKAKREIKPKPHAAKKAAKKATNKKGGKK